MNIPIAVKIECAKGEIMNVLQHIQDIHALPPCIMDGIISSILADMRAESKLELINGTNALLQEKNEEVKKAQAAAKRVLDIEQEQMAESDIEQ